MLGKERKFFCEGIVLKIVFNISEWDLETKWCHRCES